MKNSDPAKNVAASAGRRRHSRRRAPRRARKGTNRSRTGRRSTSRGHAAPTTSSRVLCQRTGACGAWRDSQRSIVPSGSMWTRSVVNGPNPRSCVVSASVGIKSLLSSERVPGAASHVLQRMCHRAAEATSPDANEFTALCPAPAGSRRGSPGRERHCPGGRPGQPKSAPRRVRHSACPLVSTLQRTLYAPSTSERRTAPGWNNTGAVETAGTTFAPVKDQSSSPKARRALPCWRRHGTAYLQVGGEIGLNGDANGYHDPDDAAPPVPPSVNGRGPPADGADSAHLDQAGGCVWRYSRQDMDRETTRYLSAATQLDVGFYASEVVRKVIDEPIRALVARLRCRCGGRHPLGSRFAPAPLASRYAVCRSHFSSAAS